MSSSVKRSSLKQSRFKVPSIKKLTESARFINLHDRMFDSESLVQAGKTPFTVVSDDIQEQGLIKLRHYPALEGFPTRHRVPVVIVAPLAINMLVYDLFEDRSLVRYLLEQGFSVYMTDWGSPTREHSRYNFEEYVLNFLPKLLEQVRQHSRSQELSLHSWSMSGVFTLLYAAATKDPNIRNIIVLGTPVSAYLSGTNGALFQRAGKAMNWIEQHTGFHPRTLPAGLLHSYGWANALGFKLLDIQGTLKGHLSMLRQLDNRAAVESHATHGAFLNHMVDYPGGINRDMLIKVWMDNGLAHGEFKIGGKIVYLKDIHAALLAGGGRSDTMVTIDAVRPLVDLVGSRDTTFATLPGGHVSMIASEAAAKEFWPILGEWLAKRSD
ncbi:alpha/beta hydrolase [Aquirhabdus sp.]|uniref:alpha/beta hydrolase n=1 Tax=Aquirhabdus sp. TaxID=2824160 RepID=UPI00396CC7BF